MLVLSRSEKQAITFPGLGISVEILEVAGNKVKVGVDAPIEVRVLRDELLQGLASNEQVEEQFRMRLPQAMRHELRNVLNEISLSLRVYLKRIERHDPHTVAGPIDAEEMFQAILKRLESVGGKKSPKFSVASTEGIGESSGSDLRTALVVDDDDNERELLAGFLRMCNYSVNTVQDGVAASNYLKLHGKPSFILLDMCMPRCNGREFLTSLRQNHKFDDTHVFVVSGHSPTDFDMSVREGYTQWFSKPLDPRKIVEAIGRIENRGLLSSVC